MLATESFFKGGRSPPKKFNHKERKGRKEIEDGNRRAAVKISRKVREVRKEMEGGNGASAASGITQFAEGEPKLWN